ncbi:MAG: hypothetical protein M3Y56_10955 [Armatimonadota bacterium]|nr:hypothetical protein [Armatimonadota bacterium]
MRIVRMPHLTAREQEVTLTVIGGNLHPRLASGGEAQDDKGTRVGSFKEGCIFWDTPH